MKYLKTLLALAPFAVMPLALPTLALADNHFSDFTNVKHMATLNKFLTSDRVGEGAACRSQAGQMRYFIVGTNIAELNMNGDRLIFRTKKGSAFSVPLSSCDMYSNLPSEVTSN